MLRTMAMTLYTRARFVFVCLGCPVSHPVVLLLSMDTVCMSLLLIVQTLKQILSW